FAGKGAKEVITPNMTANNVSATGDGTYIASDSSSSSLAFYMFKDEAATYRSLEVDDWAKIELPVRKIVYSYNLYATSSSYYIKGWELQGSNDDDTWVTLDSQSAHASWTGTLASDIEITDPAPYLYYRLLITEVNSPTYPYARVAMIYLYDKEGYKLSVVGSGSDPNYISFNSADRLDIKGDLYLAYDDNRIYFQDSGLMLGDADDRIDVSWGSYRIKSVVFTDMVNDYETELLEIMHQLSPSTGETTHLVSKFSLLNNFVHSSDASSLYMHLDTDVALLGWSLQNRSNTTYYFNSFISFERLGDSSFNGYVKFRDPIVVLYAGAQEAASMPAGSILVQGDYLYYRDSSGTWKRAATYNATPS
ncbi:MAG: hypothetical protein WC942_09400, partial [Clostridia bacterium]